MAIRPITKEQFDAIQPSHKAMTRLRVDEHEWFADESGTIIGAVIFDATEDWGWVILGRDEQREFRMVKMVSRLGTKDDAKEKLRSAMSGLEAAGKKVFPLVA